MEIKLIVANYSDEQQAKDLVYLLNCYALDPMGGGVAIDENISKNLVRELAKIPHAFSILCYVNGKAAGLINCFEGFSTFKCKPLINIHDVIVASEFRQIGLSNLMLAKVEEIAKEKGCCKLTLEVLEGNKVAQLAYMKFGFAGYQLNSTNGKALFWQKEIECQ